MVELLTKENKKELEKEDKDTNIEDEDGLSTGDGSDEEDSEDLDSKKKKVNIKRYKDPLGLTLQRMKIGLWFVKNRKLMRNIFYGFLAMIGLVTWSSFFYTFGDYLIFGIREDQILLKELIDTEMVSHDYLEMKSAKPLQYNQVKILKNNDKYDFFIELQNPNKEYFAEFDYNFIVNNKELGSNEGFVLPGEQKIILSLGQEFDFVPTTVRVNIENISWLRINKHKYPNWKEFRDIHLNFKTEDIVFTSAKESSLTEKLDLSDLKFTINNDTPYNYWNAGFVIMLQGQNNSIIGVNRYTINELMSEKVYNVNVTWPGRIPSVRKVIILPEIDITRDDIYIDF